MKINVIATGSTGNLYELVDNSGFSILIEAGVPRATFVKNRVGEIPPEMCIISHSHMDHVQYIGEFQAVMPVYLSQIRCVSEHWKAYGFPMKHGAGESMTFLIKSLTENKFLFFGTDFEYNENAIVFDALKHYGVENFMIECNYNDYLFHLATEEQRLGCSRHLSDNDVVNFIRKSGAKNPKIITIHGSNRLSADTYTKKYLSSKLLTATVNVAVGAKNKQKNLFII
jgi:ribonuclease BN (tRNA processing enzyme)